MTSSASIIPVPVNSRSGDGQYSFPDTVVVRADGPGADAVCSYFVNHLQDQLQLDASSSSDASSATVAMSCGPGQSPQLSSLPIPQEAYELQISEEGVRLSAQAATGLFYGVQSLIQLLPACPQADIALSYVQVLSWFCAAPCLHKLATLPAAPIIA